MYISGANPPLILPHHMKEDMKEAATIKIFIFIKNITYACLCTHLIFFPKMMMEGLSQAASMLNVNVSLPANFSSHITDVLSMLGLFDAVDQEFRQAMQVSSCIQLSMSLSESSYPY